MATVSNIDTLEVTPALPGEVSLGARILDALTRATEVTDSELDVAAAELLDDLGLIDQRLGEALDTLIARLREESATRVRLRSLCELVDEVQALREETRLALMDRRSAALSGVHQALGAMRGAESPTKLIERACLELCRCCGFDRALAFRVDGSRLIPVAAHFRYDPELAAEVVALGRREPPQLVHPLLEAEMLRRRTAALVSDPQNDPRTYKPLVLATGTTSYVASPIQPQGRVIGFLHADCHDAGRRVDSLDRDTLATFTEGFGYALERSILLERLKAQRRQLRPLLSSAEAILNEYCDAELELTGGEGDSLELTHGPAVMSTPESRINALLTRREIEVLRLMAAGATNALIADRLVISEGTVKSHVKHILRKLRAANRAEAVSRFMRIGQLDHDQL